jgi:hypothetical protein
MPGGALLHAAAGAGAALRAESPPGRAHEVADRERAVRSAMLERRAARRQPALVT